MSTAAAPAKAKIPIAIAKNVSAVMVPSLSGLLRPVVGFANSQFNEIQPPRDFADFVSHHNHAEDQHGSDRSSYSHEKHLVHTDTLTGSPAAGVCADAGATTDESEGERGITASGE